MSLSTKNNRDERMSRNKNGRLMTLIGDAPWTRVMAELARPLLNRRRRPKE